jgi:hypothetical protein
MSFLAAATISLGGRVKPGHDDLDGVWSQNFGPLA